MSKAFVSSVAELEPHNFVGAVAGTTIRCGSGSTSLNMMYNINRFLKILQTKNLS
jgi:hypothetical protein